MEKYTIYLKKFKIAAAILAIAIVVFILLIVQIVPVVQKVAGIQQEYKVQAETLADTERKLSDLKSAAEKKKKDEANVLKAFFKPIEMSLDTEAVISDEFGEILQLLRENKIKTRSVKYDYDPQDDNFIKNAGDRYSACRIDIEMIAGYPDFQNFLRDLYKHEHFLEISKIEIAPYAKNKRILLINLQIKLYAQKDPSLAPPSPAAPSPSPSTDLSQFPAGMDPNAAMPPVDAGMVPPDGGMSPELPE